MTRESIIQDLQRDYGVQLDPNWDDSDILCLHETCVHESCECFGWYRDAAEKQIFKQLNIVVKFDKELGYFVAEWKEYPVGSFVYSGIGKDRWSAWADLNRQKRMAVGSKWYERLRKKRNIECT